MLSLCLGACGGPSAPASRPPPGSDPVLAIAPYRCVLRDPTFAPRGALRDLTPWIARGPSGPRLVASRQRTDGALESFGLVVFDGPDVIERDLGVGAPGTLAWTPAGHLALLRDRVVRYDDALVREVGPRTTLGWPICDAALVEGGDRTLAVWGRAAPGGGCLESTPWTQTFDARGAPLAPAAPLPTPEGVARTASRALRARWDFGRFVVTAELVDGGARSWVLDPDGRVLGDAKDVVACPRSGCVRVLAAAERAGDNVDSLAQVIRVEPATGASGGASFATSTTAREVRGVVVSGDRMLVLHDTPSRAGCGLAVLDLSRRATLSQFQDDTLTCAEAHVRARPRGFVFAVNDPNRGVGSRAIDCTD